jgi:hypothetical protein
MVLQKIQIYTDLPHYLLANSYKSFEGSRSHLLGLIKCNSNSNTIVGLCWFEL